MTDRPPLWPALAGLFALILLPGVASSEDEPSPAFPAPQERAPALEAAEAAAKEAEADARGKDADATAGEAASAYEEPPRTTAAALLPASLRGGPHHTVLDAVGQDRLQHTYEIESEFGTYRVTSRPLVAIRAQEIEVLSRVTNMKGGPEFLKSLGKSLAAIPTGAVQLVLDPGQGFREIGKGLAKTGGRVRDLFAGGRTSRYEGSTGGNALYGDEQREIAAQLGLDVYSTNPQVRTFLREIGGARAAGSLGVDLASFALPVIGFAAVTTAKWQADVSRLLRDKTPLELYRHNAQVLDQLGIPRATWQAFLRNPDLSPRHKTTITRSVSELAEVKGLAAILEAAARTRDEVGALYHEQQAILLTHVHREGGGLASLRRVEHVVLGRQPIGREVVFLPVDHVYWMPSFARLARTLTPAPGAEHATRLHVRGLVTERARAELERLRFEIITGFER